MLLSRFDGLVNNDSSNRLAVLLLFGRIHAMSPSIHSKTVDHLLDWKILNLSIVICVLGLKDRDEATGTSRPVPRRRQVISDISSSLSGTSCFGSSCTVIRCTARCLYNEAFLKWSLRPIQRLHTYDCYGHQR